MVALSDGERVRTYCKGLKRETAVGAFPNLALGFLADNMAEARVEHPLPGQRRNSVHVLQVGWKAERGRGTNKNSEWGGQSDDVAILFINRQWNMFLQKFKNFRARKLNRTKLLKFSGSVPTVSNCGMRSVACLPCAAALAFSLRPVFAFSVLASPFIESGRFTMPLLPLPESEREES